MCIILENWKAEMEWKLFCCAVLLGEWSCCVVEQPEKNKGEEEREGVCCCHVVGSVFGRKWRREFVAVMVWVEGLSVVVLC